MARLHELATLINKSESIDEKIDLASTLKASAYLLGILQQDPELWFQGNTDDAAEIEDFIAQRNAARAAKNFAESDRIRDELTARGIVLEDSAAGTTWRRG